MPFDVDAGLEADVEVLLDDLTAVGVVGRRPSSSRDPAAAGSRPCGKPGGTVGLGIPQEVLLLEPNQKSSSSSSISRAAVRCVRRTVGVQNLGHYEVAVLAVGVGVDRDWLQQAVGITAFGLLGRAAVERPHRGSPRACPLKSDSTRVLLRKRLRRHVAVQPDVLELALHGSPMDSCVRGMKVGLGIATTVPSLVGQRLWPICVRKNVPNP